jgi:hypothetical protein
MMVFLEFDPAFADYNFSELGDPALRGGPSSAGLYRLAYKARGGDRAAAQMFVDTMRWTLRPEAWECFQRVHGPRPVSHREWFYAKLMQFFDVLLYDELTIMGSSGHPRKLQPTELLDDGATIWGGSGPLIQPDELEQALAAEEYAQHQWYSLVERIQNNPMDRAGAARAWLNEQRKAGGVRTERSRRGWTKNQERDQVILNCLDRGMEPALVCDELHKRTIATLPALQAKGIHRWTEGWLDLEARNAIQQLFSKVRGRKLVKPSSISK